MDYELTLANFIGPLDILLGLISKAKIELKDIFVSEITEQYLEYIESSGLLDMDGASDFLQMAATLLYIKSRSLLPEKRREDDLDENGLTPEEQLVARLAEYRRYKTVAEELAVLEERAKGVIYKLPEEILCDEDASTIYVNAGADALMAAFLRLLSAVKETEHAEKPVIIYHDRFSTKKQIRMVMARVSIAGSMSFEELLSAEPTREELAVTLLALMELLHQGKIDVKQKGIYGHIVISAKKEAV